MTPTPVEHTQLLEDVLAASSAFLDAKAAHEQWQKAHPYPWTTGDHDANSRLILTREAHLKWLKAATDAALAKEPTGG